MEYNDWNGRGKESFTTPGGTFRPPAESGRSYAYERTPTSRAEATGTPGPIKPERRTERASPFSWEGTVRALYADAAPAAWDSAAAQKGQGQVSASDPIVLSHDGESGAACTLQSPSPGGPQVYTIQLPSAPRPPAPKKRSLWWVVPALLAALLLGVLLGVAFGPMLMGKTVPGVSESPASTEPAGKETAAARIYRENVDTVVQITAVPAPPPDSTAPQTASAGTGFIISADGYLLTNAHVVSGADSIWVTLNDGSRLQATLVAEDGTNGDAALLRIDGTDPSAVIFGDSDSLRVGDWVCTIGNPYADLRNTLTAGWLSAGLRRVDAGGKTLNMLQINAAVNKGNSGGPLFDEAGRVVGMVTAKLSSTGAEPEPEDLEGLGFALPINELLAWVREICPEALD